MNAKRAGQPQQGSSLLEVLVTMLILSFGLLALAWLSAASLQYAKMAQFQSVGAELAAAYGERMRANMPGFQLNLYDQTGASSGQAVAAAGRCADAVCTSAEQAAIDKAAWLQELHSRLPGGGAFVQRDGANGLAADVWILWNEPRPAARATGALAASAGGGCPAAAVARLAPEALAPRCMHFRIAP